MHNVKRLSAEKLATAYYLGPGNALQRAASGGGGTGDFLTEHGMAEHRTAAIGAGKYELVPRGNSLSATFRGVRKAVTEEVQLLDRAELAMPAAHRLPPGMRAAAYIDGLARNDLDLMRRLHSHFTVHHVDLTDATATSASILTFLETEELCFNGET